MAGVLFHACLEAYQAQAHSVLAKDAEFPGLEWEGWKEIAERLGILDTVDAPIFRVRQAVKIAVSADSAHLSGDHVKFEAVEERLCDILSGGVSMSQVPDTQAEELMLQPAKARIVLRERRKHGKRYNSYYEVMFHNHPHEEGTWLSQGELRKHFPDKWSEMIKDFNERLASGRLLEPSPPDAGADGEGVQAAVKAAGGGGKAQQPAEEQEAGPSSVHLCDQFQKQPRQQQRQQQAWARRQAPSASGGVAAALGGAAVQGISSGGAGSLRWLSAAGGSLPPPHMPVGPRNIPLESQPEQEAQPLYSNQGQGQAPPASILLAGVGVQVQQQPAGTAGAGQSRGSHRGVPARFQQPAGAAVALQPPLPQPPAFFVPPTHPQPAYGSGYRAEQGAAGAFFVQPPAQAAPAVGPAPHSARAFFGMAPAAPGAALAAGASPAHGGRGPCMAAPQAEPAPNLARFFHRTHPPPAPAVVPVPPVRGPPEERLLRRGPVPVPPSLHYSTAGRYAGAAAAQPSRAATAVSFFGDGALSPAAPHQPLRPAGYRSPSPLAGPAAAAAVPSGAVSPTVSGQALFAAYRRKRPAELVPSPTVLGPPRPPPGWMAAAQAPPQQQQQEQQNGPVSSDQHGRAPSVQQPAAKRPRKVAPAAVPADVDPSNVDAVAAGAVVEAADATPAAAARRQEAGPCRSSRSRSQLQPARDAADQAATSEQVPADDAELAFQTGLPMMATRFQNKAPSPSKLDRQGQLLPPGAAEQAEVAGQADAAALDAFYDAQEELQQESSLHQQASSTAALAAREPTAPGPLQQLLRTQPDEVQWTNRYDEERGDAAETDFLPDTQVVHGESGAEEGGMVVPDTEEQAAVVAAPRQQQPARTIKQEQAEAATAGAQAEKGKQEQTDTVPADAAPVAAKCAGGKAAARKAKQAAEEQKEGEEAGEDSDSDMRLAEQFRDGSIRGAKLLEDGVELWVQWADGQQVKVPAARVHALARGDCPGCWALKKLNQFYESKTRGTSRVKKGGRR